MSSDEVERIVAKALVRSIIQRLAPDANGNYIATLSASDVGALRVLCEIEETPVDQPAPAEPAPAPREPRFGMPALIDSTSLDLSCLEAQPDEDGDMLAIDFGTAFSKAALWKDGAPDPTPLPLRDQVSSTSGLMLDSYVYVTDGVLYFGPEAQGVFRRENAAGRRLFESPKGELSLLVGSGLQQAAPVEIDPTGKLTKRDLLTLYLAYLMGATSAAAEAMGADRHVLRRYAIPVWEQPKLQTISDVLRRELVDAQILADSLPIEAWRDGLRVDDAAPLIKQLRASVTDEKRMAAKFIREHALEAAAAAASVGERLSNRRPVALVLDVGAGTTDVGLYRFALPESGAKVFPFKNGGGASTFAGNVLDQQLIRFIKEQAGVDTSTSDGQRVDYALSRDVRDRKATLFSAGFVDVEELDGRRFKLEDFLGSAQARDFQDRLREKITGFIGQVGAARISNPDGLYGVITGGGANASIFCDLFDKPFKLDDGEVKFERLDVQPSWVAERRPEVAPIFPQLAVAVGACSPDMPQERNAISDASAAPVRRAEVTYR